MFMDEYWAVTFLLCRVVIFSLLHSSVSFDVPCSGQQGGLVGSWLCLSEWVRML